MRWTDRGHDDALASKPEHANDALPDYRSTTRTYGSNSYCTASPVLKAAIERTHERVRTTQTVESGAPFTSWRSVPMNVHALTPQEIYNPQGPFLDWEEGFTSYQATYCRPLVVRGQA